jgi:hypothetical protein
VLASRQETDARVEAKHNASRVPEDSLIVVLVVCRELNWSILLSAYHTRTLRAIRGRGQLKRTAFDLALPAQGEGLTLARGTITRPGRLYAAWLVAMTERNVLRTKAGVASGPRT